MTRVEKNKKVYVGNKAIKILKEMVKIIICLLVGFVYGFYTIIHSINLLVAKVYSKLPRLMKVSIIYLLIFTAAWGIFDSKKVVVKAENKKEVVKVVFTEQKEQEQKEEIKQCVLGEIECSIYNKAIETGMTEEQALITVAISKHETGNWTSKAFKNKNNFGGVMCNSGLKKYSTYEEGLTGFVNLLKNRYFDKGLDTIEKIGAVYCPVGASNDPTGVNQYWIPNVTNYYNNYLGGSNVK